MCFEDLDIYERRSRSSPAQVVGGKAALGDEVANFAEEPFDRGVLGMVGGEQANIEGGSSGIKSVRILLLAVQLLHVGVFLAGVTASDVPRRCRRHHGDGRSHRGW